MPSKVQDSDLCLMSAMELRRRISAKDVSPVEVVSAVLERIERLQPALNCFITVCAEQALDQARQAEADVMAGKELGLLHGIPFGVKDIVNTKGVRTTFGAIPFQDNIPGADAIAVARLKASGAILVGKTTTPEFASKSFTDSPLFGRTPNAWGAERSAGGSSGGAAVAVASGLGPIGVATDGGGSTRNPAAANGVVGFKQSLGLIPHSQAQDLFGNQTYVTPMSRTVADTVLMTHAMAGGHASDPWSVGLAPFDCDPGELGSGDLRGKKILYCLAPTGRKVSADVRTAFELALKQLGALGAELEPFPGDGFDVQPVWRTINHSVWKARFGKLAADPEAGLSRSFLRQLKLVEDFSADDYQEAMFARSRHYLKLEAMLETADLLVTPTLMRSALPIDMDIFDPIEIDGEYFEDVRPNWFPWSMQLNMTGHPGISVPCGFGRDGYPLGLQFIAKFRQDAMLLRMASIFEAATRYHLAWPPERAARSFE